MELTPHDAGEIVRQLSSGVLGRCQGTLPSGGPCPGVPRRGSGHCALHGGAIHPALRAAAVAMLEAKLTTGQWSAPSAVAAPSAAPAPRQAVPSAPQPSPVPPGTVVLTRDQATALAHRQEEAARRALAAEARVKELEAREQARAVALYNEGVRERARAAAEAEKRRLLSMTETGRKALARIDAEARQRRGAR